MKKFDIEEYTQRKIREYKGELAPLSVVDEEVETHTSKRIRELRGEVIYWDTPDVRTAIYCTLRIRELKLERDLYNRKLLLDNRKLGSYTVSTMGDHDGES